MSVLQIVARLASSKTGVTVKVTETSDNAGTVEVVRNGQTHRGTWVGDNDEGDGPSIKEDKGSDHDLLLGAMYAWDGEPVFSLSDAELAFRSNGNWSPENS